MLLRKSLRGTLQASEQMIFGKQKLHRFFRRTLARLSPTEESKGLKTSVKQSDDKNSSSIVSNLANDEMPPKKLKLAKKVTDLVDKQTRMKIEKGAEKADRILQSEITNVETAKSKLNFANLRPKTDGDAEPKRGKPSAKRQLRAVVDIEMMKSELKQLEDPPITPEEKLLSANRLGFEFYDVPSETLAKNLLGKILVRRLENGTLLKGRIVETESYLGGEDKASQTYRNKITPRNSPMYMAPGTIYVYLTYGMYHCFNISSRGDGSGVLIRAVAPIEGTEQMEALRNSKHSSSAKTKTSLKTFKRHELSNGPSKFCLAFELNREHTKHSACTWRGLWIEDNGDEDEIKIVKCPRIGIDSAGPEWSMKPLRFYILGDRSVSKIDKKAEAALR